MLLSYHLGVFTDSLGGTKDTQGVAPIIYAIMYQIAGGLFLGVTAIIIVLRNSINTGIATKTLAFSILFSPVIVWVTIFLLEFFDPTIFA
tara:strand:- start:538 stop:807 length:270 start_codon:yes stop_codon:yes gene_type:complete